MAELKVTKEAVITSRSRTKKPPYIHFTVKAWVTNGQFIRATIKQGTSNKAGINLCHNQGFSALQRAIEGAADLIGEAIGATK